MIYQPPNSEVLFSRWLVSTVFEGRTKEMTGEIDQMDPDVLLASDPEVLAERLVGHYGVRVPRLLHDQMSMDPLEEVDVSPAGGFTTETADMYAAGQRAMKAARVTVHLPFEGRHPFVFNIRPTTRSTASPPRVHRIGNDELIVVYETTETDPDRITTHLSLCFNREDDERSRKVAARRPRRHNGSLWNIPISCAPFADHSMSA